LTTNWWKAFWFLATESMWLYGMLELERIRFYSQQFRNSFHGSWSEEFETASPDAVS
jgi:hypothetical protein